MAQNRESILSILEKSSGFVTALLTTFNFEINFFEKAVLSRLIKQNIRSISVFVDSDELTKALSSVSSCSLGQNYAVNPVRITGAFHPKVILLLGVDKARLILGSANLKLSGYNINNEIFNYFDYDSAHPKYRDVIFSALLFFTKAYKWTPGLDDVILHNLDRFPYYRQSPANGKVFFIDNSERSVLEQLKEIIPQIIMTIRIAVPYYDNKLSALQSLKSAFPDAAIQLYLQLGRSTFNETIQHAAPLADELIVFDMINAPENKNGHFYHGKVFEFISDESAYVLYGSSNCTLSALTKSKAEGGNSECNVLIKGVESDFSDFFSVFERVDSGSPMSHALIYEAEARPQFFFKYGILNKSLDLHIGFSKIPRELHFIDGEEELLWQIKDGEIVISTEPERFATVFDLKVLFPGGEENLRCWYNDAASLTLYRMKESTEILLSDSADFGLSDKYREDYEKLLQAETMCMSELVEQKRITNQFSVHSKQFEEPDLMEDDGNFVVNVTLRDEDYSSYKQYQVVEQLRGRIFSRYVHGPSLYFQGGFGKEKKSGKRSTTDNADDVKPRKATSEEQRFAKFVRRRVRGLKDTEKFVKNVSAEHYAGIIFIVFEILEKYCLREKVEGMFSFDYLLETRFSLLNLLLDKLTSGDAFTSDILTKAFDIILNNHSIIDKFDDSEVRVGYEKNNQDLLWHIDRKFHIRSRYKELLEELQLQDDQNSETADVPEAQQYLESLFGYKDLASLSDYLKKCYGDFTEIEIIGTKIRIRIGVTKLGNYLKPDITLLKELYRYSHHVEKLAFVYIIYISTTSVRPNEIARVEHEINMAHYSDVCKIIRGSGSVEEYKPLFVSF